jgi:hypothetical protein
MARKPSSPAAYIPPPESKAKRDRSWEADQRSAPDLCQINFRYIPVEIRERINELSAEFKISRRDEVARLWLQLAYDMDKAGEIDYPSPDIGPDGKLTFFPEIAEL